MFWWGGASVLDQQIKDKHRVSLEANQIRASVSSRLHFQELSWDYYSFYDLHAEPYPYHGAAYTGEEFAYPGGYDIGASPVELFGVYGASSGTGVPYYYPEAPGVVAPTDVSMMDPTASRGAAEKSVGECVWRNAGPSDAFIPF